MPRCPHTSIYIKASLFVCLFVCFFVHVFLRNRESDHHQIQSAYLVQHGEKIDGAGFARLSIGAPSGFVIPSLFEGSTFYQCIQCTNRRSTPEWS